MTSEQLATSDAEKQTIFERVGLHLSSWKAAVTSVEQLAIKRMSGLSNACFRVELTPQTVEQLKAAGQQLPEPAVLLYRRFEQELTDKRIEQAIFEAKSEDGTGPQLFFQNKEYRIEGFFEGRPISIWEMRNPMIYLKYAEIICDYDFDKRTRERIQEINPLNKDKLFVHQVIQEWGPTLLGKLDAIREALKAKAEGSEEMARRLETVDLIEKNFLFEGSGEQFTKLVPIPEQDQESAKFPLVLAHNDAQENNILMHRADNRNLMVIDYEYAGWNPMAFDLANYINETMLDNAYPLDNGIAWYLDNCMTDQEARAMTVVYMRRYYDKHMTDTVKAAYATADAFVQQELEELMAEVYACCQLNNMFWGVWALSLLAPEEYAKEGIFNYDFARSRVEMYGQIL